MDKKVGFVLGVIILAALLSLVGYFVFAAGTATLSSPQNKYNYSTTLNFSCDAAGVNSTLNASLVYNASGGSTVNGTYLITITNTSDSQLVFENTSVPITSLTEGRNYNMSCLLKNSTDTIYSTGINITIDRTGPNVSTPLSPVANSNYSRNLTLNVSVSDAITSINAVYFNITNSAGTQVSFLNTSTTLPYNSSGYYNYTLVTNNSTYPSGAYNLTVYAYDTLNNLNSSVRVQFSIDNTAPAVSTPIAPLSNGNYSRNLTLNVSVSDTPAGVASVYFNITNASQVVFVRASNTSSYWNSTINTTDGTYGEGLYNVTVYANDTLTNLNSSVRVQFTIDNTPPNISIIVGPVNNTNYSGAIVLNATVTDKLNGTVTANAGVGNVYFNITNTTGTQAAFLGPATAAGNYYSYSSLNTTSNASFPDGRYNIKVYAYDSAGNLNTTAPSINITIDNTAPTITYTCTSASPMVGESITCSCAGADSLSGLNSSTLSYTSSPSTAETGEFTLTCTEKDYAGNTGTDTFTYTVEGNYGGTSGGGAGTTVTYWTFTTSASTEQLTQGYTKALSSKQRVNVKVNNVDHYVGLTALTAATATINVSSTPQQVTLSVGDEKKFEVTSDTFYDLSVKLNGIANNKANITIKSIHEEMPAAAPGEEAPAAGETTTTTTTTTAAKSLLTNVWLWIIIVVVIIVIISLIILKRK